MPELSPRYNPKDVEEPRYQWWDAQGLFRADPDAQRPPYTIVIPPPNVTGILHMGHALNNTVQDILIRFKRMQGANALWVPGTDHAGIATQNVVEKALKKEGKKRQDLGREAFLKRVWAWREEYGNTILYQLRRLGASCDWRRTRFTMDEGLSDAVLEVFLRLHEKGLIYRGKYIINWCPRCQTALADEEAPCQQTQGKLYHIKYPLEGCVGESLMVATTRPETMLGDTAVAVHPSDERYKALIGKRAILPIVNRPLPIIADEQVDPAFGTGAVKVTPAHDPVDFRLGRKHQLESINVMTDDAHMTNVPKAYEGLDRFDCRSKLIVDLEQQGLLGPIEEHQHNVGHCYRCHTVVEPRLSPQWFVKMKPLAEPALEAVRRGDIKFYPDRWTKVYLNWMENIEDWCISRQIWWGHRLPVYYCENCQRSADSNQPSAVGTTLTADRGLPTAEHAPGVIVAKTRPEKCPTCGGKELTQDEDVLDTWFSSWLWPFSTLGWPKKTPDLDYFYPTNALVTAQEIIFFWVARMIMAGYFCIGKKPFSQVYIHGTVRDITGKKMSKSLGNIIDPLEIIEKYGTDALRYTLVTATAIGQDVFLSEERFTVGRNFANKLWNATRYLLASGSGESGMRNAEAAGPAGPRSALRTPDSLSVVDRWILSRLQRTTAQVTDALEAFQFNEAANTLYDFLWHDVCDWYIELCKHVPEAQRLQARAVLAHVLEQALRLLHPVMPFVTEELWQHLKELAGSPVSGLAGSTVNRPTGQPANPPTASSIMRAPWPTPDRARRDEEAERAIARLQALVTAVRNLRGELGVPVASRPALVLRSGDAATRSFFEAHRPLAQALAGLGELKIDAAAKRPPQSAAIVLEQLEAFLPLTGLIDVDEARAKLDRHIEELTAERGRLEARLGDAAFTERAPAEIVAQARTRQGQVKDALAKLLEHRAALTP